MHDPRFPYSNELAMPVIGIEAEFKPIVDGVEVIPEEYWRTPSGFIEQPLLKRTNKSLQLPTGGALYFDGGVLEVVTPVIEIAPQCTARVVRSLWDQIGFLRDQLDGWERRSGRRVALQAFSCHFNISFELAREERNRNRTIQKLALLLAHLLPVPAIVAGANKLSTGLGVRPRRERIEITFDFTPDPGLMAATTALIVGIVREVITWPSYRLDAIGALPLLDAVQPGKHPTRKGWVTRHYHFPRSPFDTPLDAAVWRTRDGRTLSLRAIALEIAMAFRESIRRHADPFSYRLLFSVLRGETPALLDLPSRPAAYDDVGRTTRWGSVLPELQNYRTIMQDETAAAETPLRRRADVDERLAPPWRGEPADRRTKARRGRERRGETPKPSPRLTRSAYEQVFMNVASGRRLRIGGEVLTPVGVKGWYHALFRTPAGDERLLSIDQLLDARATWV
jgi:hypothetical protein